MKFAKYLFMLLLLAGAAPAWSQAATTAAPDSASQLPQIMAYILTIAGAALFIVAMIYVVKVNQFLYKRVLDLEASKSGIKLPQEQGVGAEAEADSFWTRMRKKYWEDAVPIEREGEILSHHDFDGIRELDNRLPPWWVNMFIITIVWAVAYMFYYHWGGDGPSSTDEYNMEVEEAKKQDAIALAGMANAVDESNVTALTEAGALGEGQTIFKSVCAACHGQAGEGMVGPNMTDEYWIHGGGIKNVFKTIKYGVPEKGMISWQSQLSPSDMQKVASYILTLKGTNPPNPKEPQGEIWKEEAAAPTDTIPPAETPAAGK